MNNVSILAIYSDKVVHVMEMTGKPDYKTEKEASKKAQDVATEKFGHPMAMMMMTHDGPDCEVNGYNLTMAKVTHSLVAQRPV